MKKIDIKSVLIGILLSMVVLLLGSWKMGAAGNGNYSIACNSEGNVVYVSNYSQVMVSKDYGQTWEEIHQNKNNY